jgi:hypothetical protein
MVQKAFGQRGTDWCAYGVVQTVFTEHQRDAFAFEKDFCKSCTVFAGKASGADGLNLADSMLRMMDAIALGYGDNFSPLRITWRDY